MRDTRAQEVKPSEQDEVFLQYLTLFPSLKPVALLPLGSCRAQMNTMNIEKLEHQLIFEFNATHGASLLLLELGQTSRFGNREGPEIDATLFWTELRKEISDLICTSSKKYRNERKALAQTAEPAMGILTAFLINRFGLEAGTATALASAALLVPLKLTVQSWCASYRSGLLPTKDELHTLKKIARK